MLCSRVQVRRRIAQCAVYVITPTRRVPSSARGKVLLPMLPDPTFPIDALFFVVEDNWRLRKEGQYLAQPMPKDV